MNSQEHTHGPTASTQHPDSEPSDANRHAPGSAADAAADAPGKAPKRTSRWRSFLEDLTDLI